MKKFLYILIALVTAATALSSCINDDFSTSSSDVLSFSSDTVTFDTIMTGQGSATKQFVIYNKAKKQISISSIKVAGISKAHFYLNVDGKKGKEFHDVEIRGGDSIYVFVEGYIDHQEKSAPEQVIDRIDFVTNGVTQSVVLNAWGQDMVVYKGGTVIKKDTTFTKDRPIQIYDSLTVAAGAKLTIEPGTKLYFHDKAHLDVRGTLKAIGTKDEPIVFRGDRLDKVVGEIDFDIMSGQWGGVLIYAGSYGNELQYVDMHSSSYGLQVGSSDPSQISLHMLNCVMHNSASYCLLSINAWVEAEGTEFTDAPEDCVVFLGGKVRCWHCTFANYYLFSTIEGPNIAFFVNDDAGSYTPLDCKLYNCLSYGLGYDVNLGDMTGTNIYVYNTMFKSGGNDDDHFFNCVWAGDAKFYTDRDKYVFDYRLQNESSAIAKGDPNYCPNSCRYDRYGNDRLANGAPDLGAYVWVPAKTEEDN